MFSSHVKFTKIQKHMFLFPYRWHVLSIACQVQDWEISSLLNGYMFNGWWEGSTNSCYGVKHYLLISSTPFKPILCSPPTWDSWDLNRDISICRCFCQYYIIQVSKRKTAMSAWQTFLWIPGLLQLWQCLPRDVFQSKDRIEKVAEQTDVLSFPDYAVWEQGTHSILLYQPANMHLWWKFIFE